MIRINFPALSFLFPIMMPYAKFDQLIRKKNTEWVSYQSQIICPFIGQIVTTHQL